MSKKRGLIIDLDGTLCNNEHRHHVYMQKPRDWDKINSLAEFDLANEWCMEIIHKFQEAGYRIVFLTGRGEDAREITEKWLSKHVPVYDKLLMRAKRDYREDTEVKEEIYRAEIEPFYDILFCVDDRRPVVDMWRKIGLTCLQCADNH